MPQSIFNCLVSLWAQKLFATLTKTCAFKIDVFAIAINAGNMQSSSISKFCHCCGSTVESNFKFCAQCGQPLMINNEKQGCLAASNKSNESATSISATTSKASTSTRVKSKSATSPNMSLTCFSTFKAAKEKERSSFFVRKKGSKRAKPNDSEVKITIAVMEDITKIKRGDSLPLRVPASSSAKEILDAAVTKHATFNKRFNSKLEYVLVFKDGTEVTTVPGTDPPEPFTLHRYCIYYFFICQLKFTCAGRGALVGHVHDFL